ncbi:MAG: hypothetical protein WBV33_22180 [Terracidiphilus sp.]
MGQKTCLLKARAPSGYDGSFRDTPAREESPGNTKGTAGGRALLKKRVWEDADAISARIFPI